MRLPAYAQPGDLFLDPVHGNDRADGLAPRPGSGKRVASPLRTLTGALRKLKRDREAARDTGRGRTVWLADGRYPVDQPIRIRPYDSGNVTFAAAPGATPIIDGTVPVDGWETETVNGRTAWETTVPETLRDARTLFVNGERRPRARLPKVDRHDPDCGFFWMEDVPGFAYEAELFEGTDRFIARAGDIDAAWPRLTDAEIVVLHYWIEERLPIRHYDPDTRLVESDRWSRFSLKDDFRPKWAKYYIDNCLGGLTEPGEWFLEKDTGRLIYLPRPGETQARLDARLPRTEQLLVLDGTAEANRPVSGLTFRGITFAGTDWSMVDRDRKLPPGADEAKRYGAAAQAAANLPGVVTLTGARDCNLIDCTIRNTGWYGLLIDGGSRRIRVEGCTLEDLGAGGVRINGGGARDPDSLQTGQIRVSDNTLRGGGQVFHSGVGILLMEAFDCYLEHNHIHDFLYSGISAGWMWGYRGTPTRNLRIRGNHIHDLGYAWLSDMGGIYLLGPQPGTEVCGNRIHTISSANYGGWGIYLDEGTSHVLVQDNLACRLNCNPFNQHYGKENNVRNNVLAYGGEGVVSLGRTEAHVGFNLERNILISEGTLPVYLGGYQSTVLKPGFRSDLNWIIAPSGVVAFERAMDQDPDRKTSRIRQRAWKSTGQDGFSVYSKTLPRTVDFDAGYVAVPANHPAAKLGIRPVDVRAAGPRTPKQRAAALWAEADPGK
ncbi:MAG: right-handed parallel beta-helix repeat-containing protein [Opitutales bacterium]